MTHSRILVSSLRFASALLASAFILLALASAQGFGASRGSLRSVLLPKADIKLSAPVEGIALRYRVEEGESVKEGQVIFELRSNSEKLRVQHAEAALVGAVAELERAEKSLDRVMNLSEELAAKEVEQAQFEAKRALSLKMQAESSLALAKAEADKKVVRSPIDGVFLKEFKKPGESVNQLETIARILDISKLEMIVYVGSEYWGEFAEGQEAAVEISSGPFAGRRIEGRVTFVDKIIDPAAGTFRVKVQVDPSAEARVGFSSRIILE